MTSTDLVRLHLCAHCASQATPDCSCWSYRHAVAAVQEALEMGNYPKPSVESAGTKSVEVTHDR